MIGRLINVAVLVAVLAWLVWITGATFHWLSVFKP